EKKRLEILGLLQQAEAAAGRGDQRSVYQVVKKLAPWAPRNRVLLKDTEGRLLTHKEEHDALVSHSRALFAPQQSQPSRAGVKLPLDFPLQDVERQLQATKIGKAVPKDVAPAAAWRIGAAAIAPHLRQAYLLSATADVSLPKRWTDAWITWLPKPGKAPSQPAALRPIGLMYPEAKVLAALIKERLYDHIRPQLEWVPQFAYQPGRDLYDALARVHAWCGLCRGNLNKFTPGRFAMKEREATEGYNDICVGGAILSLDLKQAFDRVNRQALDTALQRLGAPQDLIAAVVALHATSAYRIQDSYHDTAVLTTRGIRQGCKLAPMLWVAISTVILTALGDALSGPHRQATTFADDTLCQWLIESPQDLNVLSLFLNKLLQVMEDLGLLVNLTKTFLLLKVRGPGAKRIASPGGQAQAHGGQSARCEDTPRHPCTQDVQPIGHRLKVWQACSVSSATFGLAPIGLSFASATLLRQWYYRRLRAVVNAPAHLTHESNTALRTKYGIPDPVDALAESVKRMLLKLQSTPLDITNTPQALEYWHQIHQNIIDYTTERLTSQTLIQTGEQGEDTDLPLFRTAELRQQLLQVPIPLSHIVTSSPKDTIVSCALRKFIQKTDISADCSDFTRERVDQLLQDSIYQAAASDKPLLKRHMAQDHAQAWTESSKGLEDSASHSFSSLSFSSMEQEDALDQVANFWKFSSPMTWKWTKNATGKTALQHDRVIAAAQLLTEHIVKDTTIFKLTLSLDCPNKEKIREALHALADSALMWIYAARHSPAASQKGVADKDLQKLIEDWAYEQDTGHISGLAEPPDILSIQLMRFSVGRGGEVHKLEHRTELPARLQVPSFEDGLNLQPVAYELKSAVCHLGSTPNSGHYKTMGVAAPIGMPTDGYIDGLHRALQGEAAHP
ncbi:unnamed protein product, partial [Symbiodinium sp. CCMP2456]